jgi:hypothetical protein
MEGASASLRFVSVGGLTFVHAVNPSGERVASQRFKSAPRFENSDLPSPISKNRDTHIISSNGHIIDPPSLVWKIHMRLLAPTCRKTSPAPTLCALPNELKILIMGNLSPPALALLSQSSRHFSIWGASDAVWAPLLAAYFTRTFIGGGGVNARDEFKRLWVQTRQRKCRQALQIYQYFPLYRPMWP